MARLKPTTVAALPRPVLETLAAELVDHTNRTRQLLARLDADILPLKDAAAGELATLDEAITTRSQTIATWCEAHQAELFAKSKSMALGPATVGYRTSPPAIKPLAKWTFARVLETLRQSPLGRAFIRTKDEVDRAGLLGANLAPDEYAALGVQIVQEEEFFISPHLADTDPRLTPTAPTAA